MINPNGDEFTKNDPIPGATNPMEPQPFPSVSPRFEPSTSTQADGPSYGATASAAWQQTREKATVAAQRTQFYMRENPVPTIIGALAIGLVVGLAIRYASEPDEPEIKVKPLGNVDLSFLTMPFLWPFLRSVKDRYEDSAEVVKERVSQGVDRLKEVDVDDYVKPLRKKMRGWR